MRTPDVIRANRVSLRLTQAELAHEIGVDTRQINRYETGETEPTLAVARRLAERLRISMDELAGETAPLNGVWFSAWSNLETDDELTTGAVELSQQGRHLRVLPVRSRSDMAEDDQLSWSAEMFVDRETLLGGYKIETRTLTERGLLNLAHRDGLIDGTWIRIALKGSRTGDVCLARTDDAAKQRLEQLQADPERGKHQL